MMDDSLDFVIVAKQNDTDERSSEIFPLSGDCALHKIPTLHDSEQSSPKKMQTRVLTEATQSPESAEVIQKIDAKVTAAAKNNSAATLWARYCSALERAVEQEFAQVACDAKQQSEVEAIEQFHQVLFHTDFLSLQQNRQNSPFYLDCERALATALAGITSFRSVKKTQ